MTILARIQRFIWPILAAVLLVFTAFFVAAAINGRADAQRSARVQKHGIEAVTTVTKVVNHRHVTSTKTNKTYHDVITYTSDVTLALNPPIKGHATTNLHFQQQSNLGVGQTVTVLLDPDDPGYAEQPGIGAISSTTWKVMAVLALVAGVLAIALTTFLVRRAIRGRRTV